MKFRWLVCVIVLVGCLTPAVQRPVFVSGPGPVYPAEAKRKGVEGFVVLVYDVSAAGQVENVRVEHAEPKEIFDQAALMAVRQWQFKARKVDGVVQLSHDVRSKVEFVLRESDYP